MSSSVTKPKGLFLNPTKANCSIHESGRMVFECLKLSDKYDLDYSEVSAQNRQISTAYDFYVFNYHHNTMGWLDTRSVRQLPGLKLTFVLETLRNDPFVLCPRDAFDVYCALDPTMNVEDKRVYAFPRPLEPAPVMRPYQEPDIPVVGSFGFATQGKGFELVVEAVNREFERATVRINIPPGTYVAPAPAGSSSRDYAEHLMELCQRVAKPGIEVVFSRDYMEKDELIQWCGQNTLNCFLYNRNMPGLSATTDQAISSGRPLAISMNETFRHIHSRIKPYPLRSLKESIALSQAEVLQLQNDWKPINFTIQFEKVLGDFGVFEKKDAAPAAATVTLKSLSSLAPRLKRMLVRLAKEATPPGVVKVAKRIRKSRAKESLLPSQLQPFVHPLLRSYSQFNEDLLLDLLLGAKDNGFYVDVGANDPTFNSNTRRFYERGWSGINIEPGIEAYKRLAEARPRDINLHMGVGSQSGELIFHHIPADPTLSSFDAEAARRMATYFGHAVTPMQVEVKPLSEIFATYAADKTIDFLSVDAEGVDVDVLCSNDWELYRPSLVLVEMNNQSQEINGVLSGKQYVLAFNNEYNGLFIDARTDDARLRTYLDGSYR